MMHPGNWAAAIYWTCVERVLKTDLKKKTVLVHVHLRA